MRSCRAAYDRRAQGHRRALVRLLLAEPAQRSPIDRSRWLRPWSLSSSKARTPFPVPQGVHKAHYCSQGVCTTDWFLNGAQPPQNLGESGDAMPCVTLLPEGGWNYASAGHCEVTLVPGSGQNIGAPRPTSGKYVGAP